MGNLAGPASAKAMTVGIDFDNTIVSYDKLFHRVAVENGQVPPNCPARKESVRDFLRQMGREEIWTELQGTIYGHRMGEAEAFPGALETLACLKGAGHRVLVISHRTRHPFLGPRHDLHAAARQWLAAHGFFDPQGLGFVPEEVFFEPTKEEKLARIGREACTHFIDDLPEILTHPLFPSGVAKLLFAPARPGKEDVLPRASTWPEVHTWLTG